MREDFNRPDRPDAVSRGPRNSLNSATKTSLLRAKRRAVEVTEHSLKFEEPDEEPTPEKTEEEKYEELMDKINQGYSNKSADYSEVTEDAVRLAENM